MDRNEMSTLFDVLFNNITSNQAPGLNEWEKSVFLTKAQDEVVKNYFNPKGNKYQEGYDNSAKRQVDFGMLTVQTREEMQRPSALDDAFDPRSYLVHLPVDNMFTINESVQYVREEESESDHTVIIKTVLAIRQVVPVSFEEYTTLMSKPFKEPLKYQAWRLNTGTSLLDTNDDSEEDTPAVKAEIIITTDDKDTYLATTITGATMRPYYVIRYVKRPSPIILVDLSSAYGENLAIHGETEAADCELDPTIHEEIVQRAVELAKVAWSGDLNASLQAGQRSE